VLTLSRKVWCEARLTWAQRLRPSNRSNATLAGKGFTTRDATGRTNGSLKRQIMQMNGREQRRRRWGAPRAMLLAGAPLAARQAQRNL